MMKFEIPEIKIAWFHTENVVTTSSGAEGQTTMELAESIAQSIEGATTVLKLSL